MKTTSTIPMLTAACALALFAATPARADAGLDCSLRYDLSARALLYKTASGTGVVRCENGAIMHVKIRAKALGLTAGKWQINNGTGHFTDVHAIEDVLGGYAQVSASAGVIKSAEAQVLTNGPVSLALAGDGEGVNLGVELGQLKITRR